MTTEEKAKAYDEAIKKAAALYKASEPMSGCNVIIETLFPELKESEDEKIRKGIKRAISVALDYSYFDKETADNCLSWLEKQEEPLDKGEISDGYHTFNELYYYRMLYNAAFFNLLPKEWVHKSKKHHTGEECFGGGWFIVMAELPTGQISNHYEMKDWDLFDIPEKDVADEWDGHTPQEASERLHNYLLEKQKAIDILDEEEREFADNVDSYRKEIDAAYQKGYNEGVKVTLEKQGEQKPILDIEIPFGAKDGDVLATKAGGIFIYKELLYDKPFAYCGVDKFGVFKDCNCGNGLDWTPYLSNVTPATKEQRDLLFQKMHEAGYMWDSDSKQLLSLRAEPSGEQKPADEKK